MFELKNAISGGARVVMYIFVTYTVKPARMCQPFAHMQTQSREHEREYYVLSFHAAEYYFIFAFDNYGWAKYLTELRSQQIKH